MRGDKHEKITIKSILSLSLIALSFIPSSVYAAKSNVLSLYENINYKNIPANDDIYYFTENSPLGLTDNDIKNFKELLSYCETKHHNFKTITNNVTLNSTNIISYDTENDVKIMLEVNKNDVHLFVNNYSYKIYEENDNIYLENETGDSLLIAKYIDTTSSEIVPSASNGAYTSSDDNKFGTDYGPFTKTGVHLVNILNFISDISSYYVDHPVLGKIYVASTFANVVISQSGYMTSYIKYWQSFSKTDSTYVREKQKVVSF